MKKKSITTLGALVTAAVVLLGGYIYKADKLPENVVAQQSINQSVAGTSSDLQKSLSKNSEAAAASAKGTIPSQNSNGLTKGKYDKTTFPDDIIKIQKEGIKPFGYIEANVTKVTDGDTFHINYKGEEYKVRMLDIDTPESVKAGVKPQPYSKEASDMSKKMLTGKAVKLVFEKDTTDQYDRLLAHVILKDDTYFNAFMVQNGYAICVFYSPNTMLKEYFTDIQNKAIDNKKGFWQLAENKRPFIEDNKGKFVASYKIKSKAA